MNIERESIKTKEQRKSEKPGRSPFAIDTLFTFSLCIQNSQLKIEFYSGTNIVFRNQISKYRLLILNKNIKYIFI
jgi:hypothetical protein